MICDTSGPAHARRRAGARREGVAVVATTAREDEPGPVAEVARLGAEVLELAALDVPALDDPALDDPALDVPAPDAADAALEVAAGTGGLDAAAAARSAEAWELVRRVQAGDREAFGELYDRYVDVVHRYLLFRVKDRGLAEDLTSETFVRALRRIDSVTYLGRDVGAWFVTIARNLVLDHVKSSRVRLEFSTGEMLDPGLAEGPEAQVVREHVGAAVLACVDALGPDQRECIVLRFVQGLTLAETAVLMGRGEGAVKALQHRAVRRLATLLPPDLR